MDESPTRCDFCGSVPSARRLDDVVSMSVHRSVFDLRRSAVMHTFFCDEDHFRQWMSGDPALPFVEVEASVLDDEGHAVESGPRSGGLAYAGLALQLLIVGFAIFGVVSLVMLLA